jgi:hypothetical protein
MRAPLAAVSVLVLLVCASAAPADVIDLTVAFGDPEVVPLGDGTVEVRMAGTWNRQVPGEPIVPARTARVLVPYGHRVVSVTAERIGERVIARGVTLAHGPRFVPLSGGFDLPPATPSPAIYGQAAPFPAADLDARDVQFKRGAQVLPVNLYPVVYEPAAGVLRFAPEVRLVVTTAASQAARAGVLPYRGTDADRTEIERAVDNPEALASYAPHAVVVTDVVDTLMITPASLEADVQAYADYKETAFGLAVQVTTLEWIAANQGGADLPEKIRAFIASRYASSSLQYVLLVGDADQGAEVLPVRKLFASGTDPDGWVYYEDPHMASDVYYGCLDGNYNSDGDAYWGEPNDGPGGSDVDLLFDVHVGRFPVENASELANMVNKTTAFESSEAPYKVLFVGETLDEYTSGGDHKEVVYGYTNDVPVTKIYDNDFGYTPVVNAINSNQHQWLNHVGHADVTYNMEFYSGSVGALTNTAYYLGYTHGCYCGSLDGEDAWGGYAWDDCVIEYFTAKHDAGAFAYLANTRYGFYLQGRTDGPSNVYDGEFADAQFGEGISAVGAANDDSKEDCIGMLDPMNMMRWVYYELLLFGDPQTPMQFDCDLDGDGAPAARCGGTDCDDHDPAVHPGADELCDGLDNDCSGGVDVSENDQDGDGFRVCAGDCNDYDAAVNPGAQEVCADGIDNDCNDLADLADPACAPPDDDTADDDAADDDTALGDDDDAGDDDAGDGDGCAW